MKITCLKNDLLNGINIVSKAVASKTTMSILECILIEAYNDRIRFTGNDTELGIETIIEGTVIESGQIALEARLFSDIIKKTPDSEVTIETEENGKTTIDCEMVHFSIPGRKGDDFSRLPEIEKENKVNVSQFDFNEAVRQTIFSISNNENNKLMTGELIQFEGNTMTLSSLDGHRISIRKVELAESYDKMEVIVPGKTLSEVSKILSGDAKDMVTIYISDKHIMFEFDETRVVSRVLDGKFYNISQMISTDYETKLTVNKMDFLRCLDRSTLFVKESDRKPIMLQIEGDCIDLSVTSDFGSMEDKVMAQKEGKNLVIGLNPRFMVDALRAIDDENIDIYFINSIAPCIIRNEAETYLYLFLPININRSVY